MKRLSLSALGAAAIFFTASAAVATPTTFTSSGTAAGNLVTASAQFSISGNYMTVVLTNTSPTATMDVPGSTLTGLFFDLTGNPTLTPISATASDIVQEDTCDTGDCSGTGVDVGGEFGYQHASGSGFPNDAGEGIASAGYLDTGLPHGIGNFNNGAAGSDLDSPESLDGINFGIVSSNYGNPNGGLSSEPLVQDHVTFYFSGVDGLDDLDISNVSFQYGTGFSEANVPGVPVQPVPGPDGLLIFATGLLLLAAFGYASRKKSWTRGDDARLFTSDLDEDLAV
ncbi:MAG TPA: XDD4 family exosortase-dependent surface protein [Gammaproteobacteria bacterium]|nr:XDD4 family exosortase-dependent surface protein [Gammaproteobacteria bacterium]HET7370839.1 XDD4 family exosortase-dependent surface protein [Gammaproteobacteria bacterium]